MRWHVDVKEAGRVILGITHDFVGYARPVDEYTQSIVEKTRKHIKGVYSFPPHPPVASLRTEISGEWVVHEDYYDMSLLPKTHSSLPGSDMSEDSPIKRREDSKHDILSDRQRINHVFATDPFSAISFRFGIVIFEPTARRLSILGLGCCSRSRPGAQIWFLVYFVARIS